jgi:integrase/recombinase XerD
VKTWPNAHNAILCHYIQQLHFRHAISPRVYRCILNEFARFVLKHSPNPKLTEQGMQSWLRSRASVGPFHHVLHRARFVNRFLDWMVATGYLPSHPLTELRKQYGQRTIAPIVRALLRDDSGVALEALRPLPRFGSFLGAAMQNHVLLMKSAGYRYNVYEKRLLRLDRFLQGRPDLSGRPLNILVREWTGVDASPQRVMECQQIGIVLSKALRRTDPTIDAIRFDPRLQRQVRQLYRRPHIYTEEEVRRLLDKALAFPSPRSPLRPRTLYTMLVLAYCAGLRLGEIVRLTFGDVCFDDQTLEIRDTKFFKSRRLPLSPSVMSALRSYVEARREAGASENPSAGLFWHQQASGRYSYMMASKLLVRVIQRAGLKPMRGRHGPRIHDLRHAFVVNRMLAWYQEGINPQSRLPYLATYLGHKDINSTLVYLTITQELLQQASERFRVLGARILRASTEGKA